MPFEDELEIAKIRANSIQVKWLCILGCCAALAIGYGSAGFFSCVAKGCTEDHERMMKSYEYSHIEKMAKIEKPTNP